MMMVRDISKALFKQKETEEQLEQFQIMFEESPVGTALINNNRTILINNSMFSKTLNILETDRSYNKLDDLVPTKYIQELITNSSELFAGVVTSFNQLIQIKNKDEKTIWININVRPIANQFNEIDYGLISVTDITKEKENKYSIKNTEKINTLNNLSTIFAQKFDDQLMTIYGKSYLLKSKLKDDSLQKHANTLFNATHKANDLVQKLLSFSQKNSKIKVIMNIPELLLDIIKVTKFSPHLHLQTIFDSKSESIIGNPSKLKQALRNIIDNANDAMPNEGNLFIESQSVYFNPEASKEIPDLVKGKYLRITIKDTGQGIDNENIPHLFDPFFSTKQKNNHVGLGLTISQKIINDQGGSIRISSTPLQGTTCMVYLPQQDEEQLNNVIQPNEQLIGNGSVNIMIIDDDNISRTVCGELVKKLGYNTFGFSNGIKAIQFYQEHASGIDLVILDKHLPEMNGIEIHQKLKLISPQIKVVLLTGFNIDQEPVTGFDTKDSCIVQKPVNLDKLSQAFSNLILTL
jgi:PAS domain S-box-containing protein